MVKCWCLLVVDGQSVSQHQGFLQIHHLIVNSARICLGAANSQVFQKHPKTIKNLFLAMSNGRTKPSKKHNHRKLSTSNRNRCRSKAALEIGLHVRHPFGLQTH